MKAFILILWGIALTVAYAGVPVHAEEFELTGLVGYDLNLMTHKPSNAIETKGGVAYAFSARTELGIGKIESGFIYTPTSITTDNAYLGHEKSSGAYWFLPLLYRFDLFPPFLTFAIGPDYGVVSSNVLSVNNGIYSSSDYKNHFGAEVSLEVAQDLGENLSAVLDVRYRAGLGDAIVFNNQGTKLNFLLFALGLQKRLE